MPTFLYFLLWGGLFFVLMRFGCGAHIMGHKHRHRDARGTLGSNLAADVSIAPTTFEGENEPHR